MPGQAILMVCRQFMFKYGIPLIICHVTNWTQCDVIGLGVIAAFSTPNSPINPGTMYTEVKQITFIVFILISISFASHFINIQK